MLTVNGEQVQVLLILQKIKIRLSSVSLLSLQLSVVVTKPLIFYNNFNFFVVVV